MIDPKEAAKKTGEAARKLAQEYREFVLKSNMLAMATGIVIGSAVGKVVDGIVKFLVMPIVGIFSPNGDWAQALKYDRGSFHLPYGEFLRVLVDFFIIATIVFLATKAFFRPAPAPPTKPCKMCLEPIHQDAKRCKFCTSEH
jgi:large conductance mechanosensitive channel